MEKLFEELKRAFAHQAIVEGLPIRAEHTNRFAEIAFRLCKEHIANTSVIKSVCDDCWGSGWETQFVKPCEKCKGTGK